MRGNRRKLRSLVFLGCLAAFLGAPGIACATDVEPGETVPLPDGANVAMAYYRHGESHHLHERHIGKIADSSLTADIALLRYVHHAEFAGIKMAPGIVLPYGWVHDAKLVRIPTKAASGSAGKRPPVTIQNGHLGRGSIWAV